MANTIRYIDDDAGDHVFPVTHERGVLDSKGVNLESKLLRPLTEWHLDGKGNTFVYLTWEGVIPGHSYRFYIKSWPNDAVTQHGSGYVQCAIYNNSSSSSSNALAGAFGSETVASYYDVTAPTDCERFVFGGRINSGAEGIALVEDTTISQEIYDTIGQDKESLNRKLGDLPFSETEVTNITYESGAISKTDGSIIESASYKHAVISLGNARRVRFVGNVYRDPSQWGNGYAYYDPNGDCIAAYSYDSASANGKREYLSTVPPGATTLKTNIYLGDTYPITKEEDFYAYLQEGDSVADALGRRDFVIIGGGNTFLTETIYGLTPNHRYRIYLDGFDVSGVTADSTNYIFCVREPGTLAYYVREYVGSYILPYYDFITGDTATVVTIGLRATNGAVVKAHIEDITAEYEEIKERRQNDLDAGLPVTLRFNDFIEYDRIYDNFYLESSDYQLDTTPSRTSSNETWGVRNFKIPIEGIAVVKIWQFPTSATAGSLVVDENNKIVVCVKNDSGTTKEVTVIPTINAKYLIYSVPRSLRTNYVTLQKSSEAWLLDMEAKMQYAHDVSGMMSVPYTYDNFKMWGRYSMKQYDFPSTSIGRNITEITTRKDNSYTNYLIPVDGWAKIGFRQYKTSGTYGSAFLDESLNVVARIINTTEAGRERLETVPSGAKWLFYSKTGYSLDHVDFYSAAYLAADVAHLEAQVDAMESTGGGGGERTGAAPRYRSGILTEQGTVTEDAKYVTTDPIFGNFHLDVADGYRIYEGSLVDRDGLVASYQYIMPISDLSASVSTWSERVSYSSLNIPKEYGIRLVICKADGTDIEEGETIITSFISMGDAPVEKWIPDDLPNYDVAQRRIEYMQRLLWMPLAKVPDGSTESGEVNTYFCLPGKLMTNMPYSDLGYTRKYVPINVSVRTFLTAAKNKRSLLYTENLYAAQRTSSYGMDYSGTYRCGSYYGCACNAFTAWVMGMRTTFQSGDYHNNTVPGLSSVSNASANNVRPLDLIWNDGHISIISDIYKDEYGKVVYVVWAEMTTPYCKRTIYTAAQFNARLSDRGCAVRRWSGWTNLAEPMEVPGYNPHLIGGTSQDVPYCDDIMCFAGDYASFATGDKIYLNARRAETYTDVLLYKDDVLLETIDISELAVDGSDGEDWVKVNLTTLNLSAGKYKACLTDGTNTTGYTYFEVVGVTFSAELSGSSLVATFSATGGTPVSFEGCSAAGFIANGHPITTAEVQAGSITVSGWTSGSNPQLYLLVAGDYGTVCKHISYPSAS